MKNEDLYVYKKSDFYEDFISSQKEYYEREQVDKLLAEKDKEIALLKERICNGDVSRLTWIDDCIAKDKEIAELKKKLEDVHATAYAESVDAGMRERRLRRALFIAHAIKAKFKWWWMSECKHNESCKLLPDQRKIKKFTNSAWVCSKSQEKCRAKAEQYK